MTRVGLISMALCALLSEASCRGFGESATGDRPFQDEGTGGSSAGSTISGSTYGGVNSFGGDGGTGHGGVNSPGGYSGSGAGRRTHDDAGAAAAESAGSSDAGSPSRGASGNDGVGGEFSPGAGPGPAGASNSTNGPEELPYPFCAMDVGSVILGRAGGVAAALSWSGDGIQAYVTQPAKSWVATVWEAGPNWRDWSCFDAVPTPKNISVLRKADGLPEVFVTTDSGALFVRRQIQGTWLPWKQLNLPTSNSVARDVSAVNPFSSRPFVVIADRGGVYLRTTTSDDPSAGYGPWRMIGTNVADRIATAALPSGTLQVFTLESDGGVSFAVQNSSDPASDFGEWQAIDVRDIAKLVDIDLGFSATKALTLYGVDEQGLLLQRDLSGAGPWVVLSDEATPKLLTVSVSFDSTTLFGVSVSGSVYVHKAGTQWTLLP